MWLHPPKEMRKRVFSVEEYSSVCWNVISRATLSPKARSKQTKELKAGFIHRYYLLPHISIGEHVSALTGTILHSKGTEAWKSLVKRALRPFSSCWSLRGEIHGQQRCWGKDSEWRQLQTWGPPPLRSTKGCHHPALEWQPSAGTPSHQNWATIWASHILDFYSCFYYFVLLCTSTIFQCLCSFSKALGLNTNIFIFSTIKKSFKRKAFTRTLCTHHFHLLQYMAVSWSEEEQKQNPTGFPRARIRAILSSSHQGDIMRAANMVGIGKLWKNPSGWFQHSLLSCMHVRTKLMTKYRGIKVFGR